MGLAVELPFATGDYAYVRESFERVGEAEKLAARHAGVAYVNMLAASEGHDACAGEEAWLKGAGDNSRGVAFHPFANEQRAVAALVADLVE